MTGKKRVITGIQPTNKLHIGNYIGCIKQFENLPDSEYDVFLFVPDLHALTSENSLCDISIVMKVFLATCSENYHFFVQSQHLEIPYLSWFLSCCTPLGHLERMTQFKSKATQNVNSGLLFYPVLMAADILSIDAEIVPVGIDQIQHIELTRDICDYFKNKYGKNIFIKPSAMLCENVKIQSLQDPSKKMSKSDDNNNATIFLTDNSDEISIKIKKAITDQESMPTNIKSIENTRPGVYNLCQIYSSISGKPFSYIEQTFGNGYTSIFKQDLTDILINHLIPLQKKIEDISQDKIDQILKRDYDLIHKIMQDKMKNIDEICNIYSKY